MGPPRIAFFLPDVRCGGAERVILTLAGAIATLGHQVDLVLGRAEGELLELVPEAVRIVDLRAASAGGNMLVFGGSTVWRLVRYIRTERPAAILSTLTGANLAAILAVCLSRVSVRLVLREACSLANVKNPLSRALVKRLYPWAHAVVTVSDAIRQELSAFIPSIQSNITTIYNPIDIEAIRRFAKKTTRHPWTLLERPPLVMAVGRLARQKDYSTLIKAFALVRQKVEAHLLVLGEGPCRRELEYEIARRRVVDDVELYGYAANPYSFMRSARVLVLSSEWEGFPNAILESLALGIDVVATDCPTGPKELLDAGRHGKLVPVGDHYALANAILDVLDNGGESPEKLIARAREFAVEKISRRYLDVLCNRIREE